MKHKKLQDTIKKLTSIIPRAQIRLETRERNAWEEVTIPQLGARVYVHDVDTEEHEGRIIAVICDYGIPAKFIVELDDGVAIPVTQDGFRVLYDRETASYPQFWKFATKRNQQWLNTALGLTCASEAGFRVYENKQGERILGIDTCDPDYCISCWYLLLEIAGSRGHDLCDE